MTNQIFLTGFLRSGTTLLEKILHSHPSVCIGSQPFPFLFYRAKESFYKERGIKFEKYPLGHLFLERSYSSDDLTNFLIRHHFTSEDVLHIFDEMSGYSGQLTPELYSYRDKFRGGTFLEVYTQLIRFVSEIYNKNTTYKGSKEVFCEEFTPFFLESNVKVIIIIRDPRDIVSSIRYGSGKDYVREGLPLLYILRSWRKSVAFALAHKDNPNFHFIRYEDLVKDTWATLDDLTDFLGVEPFSRKQFDNGILDQKGGLWKSNSSFESQSIISVRSIGKFKEKLSEGTIGYIESICFPELGVLGYKPLLSSSFDEVTVRDFREPLDVINMKTNPPFSIDEASIKEEIQRVSLLSNDIDEKEKRAWYIFPEVHDILSIAVKHDK